MRASHRTPEAQWRTALEFGRRRACAIRSPTLISRSRDENQNSAPWKESAYDEEAKALPGSIVTQLRDQLRRQVTERSRQKSSQFQEQRIKAAEKQLAELQRRVREGDTSTSPDREGPETREDVGPQRTTLFALGIPLHITK